ILGHPRWNDLAGGFSEADATLLLFLPTDIAGAEKILAWATDVVFLAGEGESAADHIGPASVKVVGSFGPEGVAPAVEKTSADQAELDEPELPESDLEWAEEGGPLPDAGVPEASDVEGLEFDQELSLSASFDGGGDPGGGVETDDFILEGQDEEVEGEVEIPDFGADFANLPALEHEVHPEEDVPETPEGLEGPAEQILAEGDIVLESEFSPGHLSGSGSGDSPGPEPEDHAETETPVKKKEKPDFRRGRTRPTSGRGRPPRRFLTVPRIGGGIGVLGLLAAVIGTAWGSFNVPGLTWLQDVFGRVPFPTEGVSGPQPVEPILRFSLEYQAYDADELDIAIEMRNTLRERLPDLLIHLTPMERQGAVVYALHVGPAADAVDAENLRGPLGEVFDREDPESWPIRVTPKAFLLGEMDTIEEARDFLAEAEARGALGYIVRATFPDGSETFRILSGSFDGVLSARWWQLHLRENGFRNLPLVERQGIWPE
ncbi:MAG: hypothetical protein KJN92_08810, partial [Gemmatimonadetes bacterium]|nr:hypothetical protein [Gemmatimonadota bacterium]